MENMAECGQLRSNELLVAGLGNPGVCYQNTRHNIGFKVVEEISIRIHIRLNLRETNCIFGKGSFKNKEVVLAKPLAFMNLSGPPLCELSQKFHIPCGAIIVIHDDIDLKFGTIKIKQKGGDGGHRGIRSVIDAFKNDEFTRVRLGIGRPNTEENVVNHVLSPFTDEEAKVLNAFFTLATDAVVALLSKGVKESMNCFNGKRVLKSL